MMTAVQKIALGIGAAGVQAAAVTLGLGALRFRRGVEADVADLFAASNPTTLSVVEEDDVLALPHPVQRWLRRAGVVGRPAPRYVRLRQEGRMRRGPGQAPLPVRAEQYFTTDPPGFVWIVRMRLGPAWVDGRDRYVGGRGAMDMLALTLVPVLRARGPELDQGTLLRYLTETIWFPAAVLSPHITWEPLGADSARATLDFGGVRASATFAFSPDGDVVRMSAERYRETDGHYELHPWSIPITAHGAFAGVRMPVSGSAIWHLPDGDLPYFDWRITYLDYDRAARFGAPDPSPARMRSPRVPFTRGRPSAAGLPA